MNKKIKDLKPNLKNPRLIKGEKFKKLIQSIKDFPEMLELRPIVVDEDMIILGGNMRYKACIEAGLKEVPVKVAKGLTEEQKNEFIIKDNVGFGEWDWDIIANQWDNVQIGEWGMDVWQPEEEVDYSVLEGVELDETLDEKTSLVKRGIVIEFDISVYDEAYELIDNARKQGNDVGLVVLKAFREL